MKNVGTMLNVLRARRAAGEMCAFSGVRQIVGLHTDVASRKEAVG